MTKTFLAALAAAPVCNAWAHEGHGMGVGSHWHATDAAGLVFGLGAALLALWWTGRK